VVCDRCMSACLPVSMRNEDAIVIGDGMDEQDRIRQDKTGQDRTGGRLTGRLVDSSFR
jgi:hypothetical protein